MATQVRVALGQCSEAGPKEVNQDFHGAWTPREPQLSTRGVAVALADGISTSDVSDVASETAVTGFLDDYYSTPDGWTVKHAAHRVLMAINSWLYAQTRCHAWPGERDRGYVCTFTALVIKSATAHIFHVGDTRAYRLAGGALEQLTNDHRVRVSAHQSYLGAALGIDEHIEIEYHSVPVVAGDIFVLTTDGVHDFITEEEVVDTIAEQGGDLERAARVVTRKALERGSDDNLTIQLVRAEQVGTPEVAELYGHLSDLPFPPMLDTGVTLDGYQIIREIHASHRSHVYLAVDLDTGERVALKTLATECQQDIGQIERFLAEEWIARRINSPHVTQAHVAGRPRHYLYTVTRFIEGQTLTQWMRDRPRPELARVRDLVEQIARGVRAFHRAGMIHQDLRPDNVLIDTTGTVKLVDFGSTRVAGLVERTGETEAAAPPGTVQYSAPEYFLGESGSERSDIFSLGVITYQMLTGHLPYGADVAAAKSRLAQYRLRYRSVLRYNRDLPAWIDGPLRKAVHPDPNKRHQALSEFVHELRNPRPEFADRPPPPLLERNPLLFWQAVSLLLAVTVAVLAGLLAQ